jgi:cell wall-associated NlpC family hydrolase
VTYGAGVSRSVHVETPRMTRVAPVRAAAVAATLVSALLGVSSASADPAELGNKRAEAERVLAEIHGIDQEVGRAAEAWNHANLKLDSIAGEQRRNARMLKLAKRSLRGAQQALARRAVTLYTSGASDSAMEILLGSKSLDELLDRLDTAERVSTHDAHVVSEVKDFRAQVHTRAQRLARARAEQERVVAARAAAKREIEAKLSQRQALLNTIRGEIARLEREERARQAALERQARARLRAQQQAAATAEEAAPAPEASTSTPVVTAEASAAEEATAAAPPARYGGVVGIAMRYLGVPYKWGGASPSGFDCSGFVMYVYGQIGVSLPHYTGAMWNMGSAVSRGDLQAGDLVFFNGLGHMGIYIGGGSFIHAPHTGDVVKISSMSGWYAQTYVGARRI